MNLEYCKKLIEIKEQTFYDTKVLKLLTEYILKAGLIVYGGTAIHYLLKEKSGRGIYEGKKFYDWDVYSFDIENDISKILSILNKAGYFYINVKSAIHVGTKRIYVNFSKEPIIDITEVSPSHISYRNIGGYNIIDPLYIKRDMYFLLNFNFYRYTIKVEKYINRLKLLEKNFPGFRLDPSHVSPQIKKKSSIKKPSESEDILIADTINPIESTGSNASDFPMKSLNVMEIIKKYPDTIISGDYIYNYYFDPKNANLSEDEIIYIVNTKEHKNINVSDVYKYDKKIFFFYDNECFYRELLSSDPPLRISHKLTLLYCYYHVGIVLGTNKYQKKILKILDDLDSMLFNIESNDIKLKYSPGFII